MSTYNEAFTDGREQGWRDLLPALKEIYDLCNDIPLPKELRDRVERIMKRCDVNA